MRANPVKRALKEGKPCFGTWLSLGNVLAARFLARSGFHWINLDIEHSMVGWETAANIFASVADAGCTALARVPANRHDHIKRVLDNGAHGIVVPMVNTRQEAEYAVNAMYYPPKGNRSVGGSAHALNFDATAAEYYEKVNDEVLVILQCEHIQSVENADAIFSVPGVDAIFVGPNDLAWSMKDKNGNPPSAEATKEAMKHILDTCKKHGVAPGLHVGSAEEALLRAEEGWQFIAIGSELKFMLKATSELMEKLGQSQVTEMAKY